MKTDPPSSVERLAGFWEAIFSPLFAGNDVILHSLPGMGNTSTIKYLLDNWSNYAPGDMSPGQRIYIDLDSTVGELESVSHNGIQNLLEKTSGSVFVVVVHADVIDTDKQKLSCVKELLKANPMRVRVLLSFEMHDMIWASGESREIATDQKIMELGMRAKRSFAPVFDRDSCMSLIKNQENWFNHPFSDEFKEGCIAVGLGDPTIMKVLVKRALVDEKIENFLEQLGTAGKSTDSKDLLGVFEHIDRNHVEARYDRIFGSLSDEYLDWLEGRNGHVPKFLVKVGLVDEKGEIRLPLLQALMNDGYAYERKPATGGQHRKPDSVSAMSALKADLSAQEFLFFKLLSENSGEIISKEQVAQAIWGEAWSEKYSEQALDKISSRLRAKLKDHASHMSMRTVRGRGYLLETPLDPA